MDPERDTGLMAAPESELLHEIARLRCENERLRLQLLRAEAMGKACSALVHRVPVSIDTHALLRINA